VRRVKIVERANETYAFAATDTETGAILLRLSDRAALAELCHRLGWTVQGEPKSADETYPADLPQQRKRFGRARSRVGGATKFISARRRRERRAAS
jgi:hypothetical protein